MMKAETTIKVEVSNPHIKFQGYARPPVCANGEDQPSILSDLQGFAFCNHIGKGGQGECSLIKRHKDGKLFVLKVADKFFMSKNNTPLEIQMTNQVLPRYKRIVRVHHAAVYSEYAHIFMEYCDGGDLHNLIKRYQEHSLYVPESFIWHVFIHLAEALAFLHRDWQPKKGYLQDEWETVLHRDIKPANIFLRHRADGAYPDIVLGDFGLAGLSTDRGYDSDFQGGTAMYQPPELPQATEKGDVWALGAVIHALAGNGPPMKRVLKDEVSDINKWWKTPEARQVKGLAPCYSKCLQEYMLTCLRPNPLDRIESVELAAQLQSKGQRFRDALYTPLALFIESPEAFSFCNSPYEPKRLR